MFLTALLLPWAVFIGPVRLSIYRVVLLVVIFPCLGMWLTGKAGRIRAVDMTIVLFSVWFALSLILIHGSEALQTVGIGLIETLGPYLLARCYIRDADDFYKFTQLLFRIILVLFPFAFVEFLTGHDIWRDWLAALWPVSVTEQMPPRGGLTRVQMGFDHPILFGVFVASGVAPVYLVLGYRKSIIQRAIKTAIVAAVSFTSLSAGAVVSMAVQIFIVCCDSFVIAFKIPWKAVLGLIAFVALALQLVANRSLLDIIVGFLIFDPETFWYRKLIWQYGGESVFNHPFFGIGLNDWERPSYMSKSIDNFWLLLAMRHGLPAPLFLLLTLLSICFALGFKKDLDEKLSAYRTAFLSSLIAFFVVGWTVHFWDAGYVYFMFTIGSGIWLMDARSQGRPALRG